MTFSGVMAIILRYFTEFSSLRGQLRKIGWLAIKEIFSREMSWCTPTKHDGRAVLFAVAELLIILVTFLRSLTFVIFERFYICSCRCILSPNLRILWISEQQSNTYTLR